MRKPKTTAGRSIAAEIERDRAEHLAAAKAAAAAELAAEAAAEARRVRAYADAKAKTRAWHNPAAKRTAEIASGARLGRQLAKAAGFTSWSGRYDPAAEGAAAARQDDYDRKADRERARLAAAALKQADDLAVALAALRRICELPASRAVGVAGKALRQLGQPVPQTQADRDLARLTR